MNDFEQLYWQFLSMVAAAQDRCEAAVAALTRCYDDSGQDVPKEVLDEYTKSHEALTNIVANYPGSQTQTVRLASTA